MADSPELEEILEEMISERLTSVSFSFPAKIQKVSSDGSKVDLVPLVKQPALRMNGQRTALDLPALSNVPYGSVKMGAFEIIVPAAVGAFVTVVVSDYDFSTWLSTGELGEPNEFGSHTLSGSMALPMCIQPAASYESGKMKLGHTGCQIVLTGTTVEVGGNTDPVALSSMVNRIVNAIRTAAITPAADGGLSFKTGLIAALDLPTAWTTSASTKLKVGG